MAIGLGLGGISPFRFMNFENMPLTSAKKLKTLHVILNYGLGFGGRVVGQVADLKNEHKYVDACKIV